MCVDVRLSRVIVSHEAVRSVAKMQWQGLQAQLVHKKGHELFFFFIHGPQHTHCQNALQQCCQQLGSEAFTNNDLASVS
jgi:hypothetical protein